MDSLNFDKDGAFSKGTPHPKLL